MKILKGVAGITAAVLLLTLLLMPPERHVGRLLTLIYLHGALIRSGAALFVLGGVAAIWALITDTPRAWRWVAALQITAWTTWVLGFIVSFYPSYVTWGAPVVWAEPRTRMVVNVALIAGVLFLSVRWLEDRRWLAAASLLIAVTLPLLLWRTGVIRHPLDPIGSSPSNRLRLAYSIILLCTFILGGIATVWLQHKWEESSP